VPDIDPDDPLLKWAVLGRMCEEFIGSDVGQFLLSRAQREAFESIETLKSCPATDYTTIIEARATLRRAENFEAWLREAIEQGMQATQQLESEHGR
jgi:hypothetical protein